MLNDFKNGKMTSEKKEKTEYYTLFELLPHGVWNRCFSNTGSNKDSASTYLEGLRSI
jgi:hypothetical protein